jgi:hypothetical protein
MSCSIFHITRKVTKYDTKGKPYDGYETVSSIPQKTREELRREFNQRWDEEDARRAEMRTKYPNASASINLPSEQTLNDYYDKELDQLP